MELTFTNTLLVFISSFATSALVTPLFRKLAIRLNILDLPTQSHKTHSNPVPYLGGLSIILTVLLGVLFALNTTDVLEGESSFLLAFISAPLILSIVGLIDDIKGAGPYSRLIVQLIASLFAVSIFYELELFGSPSRFEGLNFLVSIVWIVGITNAVNFIDNLDGGAGGVIVISTISLAIAGTLSGQNAIAGLSILIAGSVMGFLVWNLQPARIYLGDAGALFLGSIVAVLFIRFDPDVKSEFAAWIFAIAGIAVPILDTSVAVISRLIRGVSPIQGGRDHLSHRLLEKGFSRRQTASIIWMIQAYFCVLALSLSIFSEELLFIPVLVTLGSWLFLFFKFLRTGSAQVT